MRPFTHFGLDEVQWQRGHNKYVTLVYQIDAGAKRLLYVTRERTDESLRRLFFRLLLSGPVKAALRFVSDTPGRM